MTGKMGTETAGGKPTLRRQTNRFLENAHQLESDDYWPYQTDDPTGSQSIDGKPWRTKENKRRKTAALRLKHSCLLRLDYK